MKNTALARARLEACRRWPAATSAILTLIPIARPGLGTAAVDMHWRLYFDPEYVASVPPDEVALMILHEVSHLLLKHHERCGGRDHDLYNQSADLAVNFRLQAEGHAVPAEWLTPNRFQLPGNLTAEQYYRLLEERRDAQKQEQRSADSSAAQDGEQDEAAGSDAQPESEDQSGAEAQEQGSEEGDSGQGDEPGDSDGQSAESQQPGGDGSALGESDAGDASEVHGDGSKDGGVGEGESYSPVAPGVSGSCSDGQLKPWEEPAPANEGDGPPAIEPHEQEQIIRRVAEAIEAKGSGKGAWSGFVQNILHPKIDPRVLLTQTIRKAVDQTTGGHDDTSYRRPSRRPSVGGVIRPSRVAIVPRICLIIDSSGSMGEKDLGLALGMVGKVLSGFRLRDGVQVMVGDTAVQSCGKVFDPKKLAIKGRGGTAMEVLIEAASKLTPQPQLLVLITDGYTSYPPASFGVPCVACITRERAAETYRVPSWIKPIVLTAWSRR